MTGDINYGFQFNGFYVCIFAGCFCPALYSAGIRAKNALLLLASVIFYAYGEPVYIILLFISTLLNYFCACGIDRFQNHRKGILVLAVTAIWESLCI